MLKYLFKYITKHNEKILLLQKKQTFLNSIIFQRVFLFRKIFNGAFINI